MPPTSKPNPAGYTDQDLARAVAHLHRDQAVKGVKRVGAEFHAVNSKKQLVITGVEVARRHAAYLDSLPDDHPDLAGPGPEADVEAGDSAPAD